jgi:hypothetical protein
MNGAFCRWRRLSATVISATSRRAASNTSILPALPEAHAAAVDRWQGCKPCRAVLARGVIVASSDFQPMTAMFVRVLGHIGVGRERGTRWRGGRDGVGPEIDVVVCPRDRRVAAERPESLNACPEERQARALRSEARGWRPCCSPSAAMTSRPPNSRGCVASWRRWRKYRSARTAGSDSSGRRRKRLRRRSLDELTIQGGAADL